MKLSSNPTLQKYLEKYPWIISALIILVATVLGVFLRLQYVQKSDFPLNDGGLFFTMTKELVANQFRIPAFTSYNHLNIPFAYPPLSFYIAGFYSSFLHGDLLQFFRLYPLIINILSIPAYYFLVKELTDDQVTRYLAVFIYAISMPGYEWLIVGGGLTRSPAHTLFILSLTLYLVYLRNQKRAYYFCAIILTGVMALHHAEYAWLYALTATLFSFVKLKPIAAIKHLLGFFLAGMVITGPYWFAVISQHGLGPVLAGFSGGDFGVNDPVARFILLSFSEENLITFLNIMIVIGLFYLLYTRNYPLIFWTVVIGLFDSRSANRGLVLSVSIIAALGVTQIIIPGIRKLADTRPDSRWKIRPEHLFLVFSVFYPFFIAYVYTNQDHSVLTAISQNELDAMNWVSTHTSSDAAFAVVDRAGDWPLDYLGEWFPTLTNRTSIATIQGTEWLPEKVFYGNIQNYRVFKKCIFFGPACVEDWAVKNGQMYDYIFISSKPCNITDLVCLTPFENFIANDAKYSQVYANNSVTIYAYQPATP